MTRTLFLFLALFLSAATLRSQPLRLMQWNVENMFHPSDDPLTSDDDFTPTGSYRWTFSRFFRKANRIAQTVAALRCPDLIALCEIEDDSTLIALTEYSVMRTARYRWTRTHGSDPRGINIALLYNPFRFRPGTWLELRVPSAEHGFNPTRNILYVKGEAILDASTTITDTLHLILCHLPSQAGGTHQADRHRRLAAQTIKDLIDSIQTAQPQAAIILTGDFNSDSNSRIMKSLQHNKKQQEKQPTGSNRPEPPSLKALPFDFQGTYRYQGDWTHLDHILCTDQVLADTAHIFRPAFLLEENRTHGGPQPHRTFRGPSYHDGISDHLPIYTDLHKPR